MCFPCMLLGGVLLEQGYMWELVVCVHLCCRRGWRMNKVCLQNIVRYQLIICVKYMIKVEKEKC